jgi:hypothetical protein
MYRKTVHRKTVTTAEGHEFILKLVRVAEGVKTDLRYEVTLSAQNNQVLGRIEDREAALAAFDACFAVIAGLGEPHDMWGRRAKAAVSAAKPAVRAAKDSARNTDKPKPRKRRRSVRTISGGLPTLGKRRR